MSVIKFLFKLTFPVFAIIALSFWYFYSLAHPALKASTNPLIVNDVTGLNPVTVNTAIRPTSEQEIVDAIKSTQGPVSIGGARYSMGGQIAYPDSLHLDMRAFNQILDFKPEQKLITVQTGITWREVQKVIDPHDLSVKIMQDFTNFTVGGALSVNAHGRFMGMGPIINSVRSIEIILADGQVYEASREENSPLFYAAIGGYGGIGVITQATLELIPNATIERSVNRMGFNDFLIYFNKSILSDKSVVLHNALLYPPNYESVLDISWRETDKQLTEEKRLRQHNENNWWRPLLIDFMTRSDILKNIRKELVDPLNFDKPAVVRRNWETSYDLRDFGFFNNPDATLALREYFVPVNKFEVFVLKLRDTFMRHDVDVLNISIRYAPKDTDSILSWAKSDVFSFIVVYRQGKDEQSLAAVETWSQELLKGALGSLGSFYLPFQTQATLQQFMKAYPSFERYLTIKKKADPDNRFNNMLLAKYTQAMTDTTENKVVNPLN